MNMCTAWLGVDCWMPLGLQNFGGFLVCPLYLSKLLGGSGGGQEEPFLQLVPFGPSAEKLEKTTLSSVQSTEC